MIRTIESHRTKTTKQKLIAAVQCVNKFYSFQWLTTKTQETLLRLMHPEDRMYWLKKLGYNVKEIRGMGFFKEEIKK